MIDSLRSHPTTLALLAVCFLTWQGLSSGEEQAKAGGGGELPIVDAEAVERRPLDAPKVKVRNPFSPLLLSDKVALSEDGSGQGKNGESSDSSVVVERLPAFVLRLDSIFSLGLGGGHARINGRDVEIGDVITDCDPGSPPELVSLSGLTARIGHRGQSYDLHLDLVPRLELGGEVIRHQVSEDADLQSDHP